MKRLVWIVIVIAIITSMIFSGSLIGCKEETAEKITEEEAIEEITEEEAVEEITEEEAVEEEFVLQEPEIKEITLHFQGNTPFAAHAVAIAKGYFEEAGFTKVDKATFTSGNLAGEALVAGEIQLWSPSNMPAISMKHNGVPIVVVGLIDYAYIEELMVNNDVKIEKPEDLYDIKIGLMVGSSASAIIGNIVAEYGLDEEKLNLVNLAPPEQVTALQNNDIQALLVWSPWPAQVRDIAYNLFDTDVLGGKVYTHTLVPLVFSEDFITNYPIAATNILYAMYKGIEFCKDPANKAEAIEIFAEYMEQPVESVTMDWPAYWENEFAADSGVLAQRFVDDFDNYTTFQLNDGRIEEPIIGVLDYTYTGILEEIAPEYVEVKGNWKP